MNLERDFVYLVNSGLNRLDKVACVKIAIDSLVDTISKHEKEHRIGNEDFSDLSATIEHLETALGMIDDETIKIYQTMHTYRNDTYKDMFVVKPKGGLNR